MTDVTQSEILEESEIKAKQYDRSIRMCRKKKPLYCLNENHGSQHRRYSTVILNFFKSNVNLLFATGVYVMLKPEHTMSELNEFVVNMQK